MGCAARVLEFDPLEEVRRMAHEQLDQWLEQMRPLFEQEKPPTLLELSQHFTRTRQQLLGGVLQSLADALYAHLKDQRQAPCPCCGKPIRRKRLDPKRCNTLQGPVDLERGYFYCSDCRVGFHPLDEAMELSRAFHQYDVEEKVLKLATEMPYERAAELVSDLTGVPVSNRHAHQRVEQVVQLADLETVIPDRQEIRRRIAQDQVRIALLGDGAAWVWNTLETCFPEGRPVLDYYHCAEHVHKVADAHYGNCARAIEWVEVTLARLAAHQVDAVIWCLQRLQADAFARAEIDKLITYLQNHRQRIDYDACKAEGLPIGSGAIESANKFISHARLKRSGAWWVVENGNGMLRLRCALYNGTFDRVFQKYRSQKVRIFGTKA